MKYLILTVALLISLPVWAGNNVCLHFIRIGNTMTDMSILKETIKNKNCDVIKVHTDNDSYLNVISQYCRFDRQIIIDLSPFVIKPPFEAPYDEEYGKERVYFSCVPVK